MENPSLSKNNKGVARIANRQSGRVGWAGATLLKLTVLRTDTLAYINQSYIMLITSLRGIMNIQWGLNSEVHRSAMLRSDNIYFERVSLNISTSGNLKTDKTGPVTIVHKYC